MKNLYYITLFLLFTATICGSQSPIRVVKFTEYTEIKKGEKATIYWEFQNAQKVKISGIETVFNALDSAFIAPERTEFYTITVYQGKKDSLKLNFIINVISQKAPEKISEIPQISEPEKKNEPDNIPNVQRGPIQYKYKKLGASFEKNEFLSGEINATAKAQPSNIKIMRTINPMDNEDYILRVIPMDEYGNLLGGLENFDDINWSVERESLNLKDKNEIDELYEQPYSDSIHIDFGIALDNSAASSQQIEILSQIKNFLQLLAPDDNFFLSTFNQNYLQMFALSPPEKALWELDNLTLNKPEGLNSLHKAAFKTIEKLGDGYYDDRICVLITFNSDNSSIIYTANDVATIAQESETPVYVIAVGNSVESYSLRFITEATGGKFYHIFDNEIDMLGKILIEIALSQKGYYEFTVPIKDLVEKDELSATLTLTTKNKEMKSKANLILKPKLQPVKYQIVAGFDYKESYIKTEYEDMLNSLAYILTNNPGQSIQLIGHSGNEGSDKDCYDLSVQRAENVKAYLISQQIPAHQVKAKGEGNHKPLYFSSQTGWQNDYNRRVEIKWLDPELTPYEISTDIYESQEEAEKSLEFWNSNGYKAYFDRMFINGKAHYEVKIWGFGTLEQAEKTAATISSKYKKKVSVD